MLEFDDIQHMLLTRAPALTARYEFLSFRDGAGGRAWVSAIKETIHSAASMRAGVDQRQALGDGGFHLERASRAWTGRGFARVFSGGVQAGHGGAGGGARRHWLERARTLGRRPCEPRSARDRHSLCAGRGGARPVRLGAREACRRLPRRRGPLRARPSRHSAVRLRPRAFWLSRPSVAAGHRGGGRGADARLRRASEGGRVHPWLP